jgi:hypothetical protein
MVIGGFTSTATPGEFLPQLPASFIEALEDFESGRVVDMETALNEPPLPDA